MGQDDIRWSIRRTDMTFHSFNEFLKYYYPQQWKRDQIRSMTPRQFGEHLAKRVMKRLREALRNSEK